MFSDFYEKFNFKKTTPEEKQDVVKNTGEWFPEQHDNKIKGMDKVVNSVIDATNKKEIDGRSRKGFYWRNCDICGKVFESYRKQGRYCSEDCRKEGWKICKKRYDDKVKLSKTQPVTFRKVNTKGRAIRFDEAMFNKVRHMKEAGIPGIEIAKRNGFNVNIIYQASGCKDYNEFCKKYRGHSRACEGRVVEVPESNPIVVETTTPVDYFEVLHNAIDIVRVVKNTDDIKECVDKVYAILNKK